MSDAELRVAAKAIDGFIARVEKLEAENAELKADSEACREVILELEAEVERLMKVVGGIEMRLMGEPVQGNSPEDYFNLVQDIKDQCDEAYVRRESDE